MTILEQLHQSLDVVRNMFPEVGLAIVAVIVLYLARQGWRTRDAWQIGPPWSEYTHYLRRIRQAFGHIYKLGYGQQAAFYVLASQPASPVRPDATEAQNIESLIGQAVLSKRSLLVTGGARSGKTTFLQALAGRVSWPRTCRKLGFAKPRIPLYLPLSSIDPALPFLKAVGESLSSSGFGLSATKLSHAITSGCALFLLDGLDAVPTGPMRSKICRWIEDGVVAAGKCLPFIITCRSDALLEGVRFSFPYLTIAIRNYALLQFRSLRAVSETRMPIVFKNSVEHEAEYLLISPPPLPVILKGARKPAPQYFYYLAKYPVTNRLYRLFVEAVDHRRPPYWDLPDFSDNDLPVVGVDWEDAEAYCDWLNQMCAQGDSGAEKQMGIGKFVFRLPTEEEWEWAAGGGKRRYPWGDARPATEHANFAGELCRLTAIDAHRAGATPEGLMGMAGNIWEWTSTWRDDKHYKRVVRGGAAFNTEEALQCVVRDAHAKDLSRFIGFRVARFPEELEAERQ